MNLKEFRVYNVIFLLAILIGVEVVRFELTGQHLYEFGESQESVSRIDSSACLEKSTQNNRSTRKPSLPQVQAVLEYEKICGARFFSGSMYFTDMPIDEKDAVNKAQRMAATLREFKAYNLEPLVIVEPDSKFGLIDFEEFAKGFYTKWIDVYFQTLKSEGITNDMMGTWIPFPEPQQEFWNNNEDPETYAKNVNIYAKIVKRYFKASKVGVLLDSQVNPDVEPQLLAYTRLIDNSLIDVAGVQGFPWHPIDPADTRLPVLEAAEFLPAELIQTVADSLGTKKVLVNTGTFRHRRGIYGSDITVTTRERADTLDTIVDQLNELYSRGYSINVNIFSENKLDSNEAVDWSYWGDVVGDDAVFAHRQLFSDFVGDIAAFDANMYLYDVR